VTNRILVWKDVQSWKNEVSQLLTDSFNETIESLNQTGADTLPLIDKEKMQNDILKNKNSQAEYTPLLITKLLDHYDRLKAYHACRPVDVQSYFSRGLEFLDQSVAYDYFLSGNFPELNKKMIDDAINDLGSYSNKKRLDLHLDAEFLIKYANHYLQYGSEFLQAVAVSLKRIAGHDKDYKETLKQQGTATIFICEIPFSIITYEELSMLCGSLIEILSDALKNPDLTMPEERDYTISLFEKLPPEYIVDHYHPKGF
jgi:hypothetical protein